MNTEKLLFMPDHHPEIQYLVIINPDPNWAFPLHSHDDALEISLIFSGVSHFTCQNKTINVMKDSLIVKNAGLPHSEKSDADSPITQICIMLDHVHISGYPNNQLLPESSSPIVDCRKHYSLLAELFTFIKENYKNPQMDRLVRSATDILLLLVIDCLPDEGA
jgi:hypothetical protein